MTIITRAIGAVSLARAIGVFKRQEAGLVGVLVVLGIALSLANNLFLTSNNLYNVVQAVAVTGIISLGEAMVLIGGEIDLSVGSVLGLSSVTAAWLMSQGLSPVVGILGGIATGALVGLLQGSVIVYGKVNSFIVTLGTLSIGRGLTALVTGGMPINVPDSILFIGQGQVLNSMPISVLLFVVLAIIAQVVLSRSVFGQRVIAVGDNREAARLGGIPLNQTRILVFVLSGVMAAVGGVVYTSQVGVAEAQAGTGIELDVIAAVVIGGASLSGGRGSMIGAFLGACLLGVLRNAFILLRLSPFLQQFSIGLVIILAVLFDQFRQGAFRRPRIFGGGAGAGAVPGAVANASDVGSPIANTEPPAGRETETKR